MILFSRFKTLWIDWDTEVGDTLSGKALTILAAPGLSIIFAAKAITAGKGKEDER